MMLNFRQNPGTRNYFTRREQWRLLTLVMGLGLVFLLINEARDPANYAWLEVLFGGGADTQATPAAAADEPTDDRSPTRPSNGDSPGENVAAAADRNPAEEDAAGRYFPGVKPEYLESIRDNTVLLAGENDAWFHLFDILQRTDEEVLARESTGRAFYAQLDKQPNAYRGELVTLVGTVRRAHLLDKGIPKNKYGIKRYYQLWVFLDDNPTLPMVVYCLELPEGFPTGMEIEAETTIHGFYFKRWLTRAQTQPLERPLLAARTVHWTRRPPERTNPASANPVALLVVLSVAVGAGVFVIGYVYLKTRPVRHVESGPPPNLDALRLMFPPDAESTPDPTGRPPDE